MSNAESSKLSSRTDFAEGILSIAILTMVAVNYGLWMFGLIGFKPALMSIVMLGVVQMSRQVIGDE